MEIIRHHIYLLFQVFKQGYATIPRYTLLPLIIGPLVIITLASSIGDLLTYKVQQPLEFQLRSKAGMDPEISSQIKSYSYGDKSISAIGTIDIPLDIWGKIIRGLSDAGAKYIIIDKLFGAQSSEEHIASFRESIKNIKSKVIIGAFLTKQQLLYRDQLSIPPTSHVTLHEDDLPFDEDDIYFVYGATKSLQKDFQHYGHINYEDSNRVKSYIPFSRNQVLPAAVLHVGRNLKIDDRALLVDGIQIPVDQNNNILLNLAHPNKYEAKQIAFKSLYFRAQDGVPITLKPNEKYIFLHQGMYTGGTDFVETAHGTIPGGFTHIALLNSFLENDWLYTLPFQGLFLLILGILGYSAAILTQPRSFILLAIGLPCFMTLFGLGSFIYLKTQTPWLSSILSYLIIGGITFLERSRETEIKSLLLQKDLELGKLAQNLFLPDKMQGQLGSYSFEITFQPYGALSGDWVQTFFHTNFSAIALGDVVGKGPGAALATSVIATVWSQHCEKWLINSSIDIPSLINDINKTIFHLFRGKQFTTFSCVVFEQNSLRLYNLGAPPWLNLRLGDGCHSIRTRSKNPLGLLQKMPVIDGKTLELAKIDTLIAYTDGVMDGTASRRFLSQKMKSSSVTNTDIDFNELVYQAGKDERLADDYTILFIRKHDLENELNQAS